MKNVGSAIFDNLPILFAVGVAIGMAKKEKEVAALSAVIAYFVIILMFLKKKSLSLKYTLLWLLAGFILGIMVIWPELLTSFIHLLGIVENMNGLFILCIAFIIMILMSITSIVSRQAEKIKNLTQTISKMEKRIRELEDKK